MPRLYGRKLLVLERGERAYMICSRCGRVFRFGKPILGMWHVCWPKISGEELATRLKRLNMFIND